MAHYGSFMDLSSLDSDELEAQDQRAATATHASTSAQCQHGVSTGAEKSTGLAHDHERAGAYDWCDDYSSDDACHDQDADNSWWAGGGGGSDSDGHGPGAGDRFGDGFGDGFGGGAGAHGHGHGGFGLAFKKLQRRSDPGTYTLSESSIVSKLASKRCNSLRRSILLRSYLPTR